MAKPQKPEQLRELKTEELEQKLAVLAEAAVVLELAGGVLKTEVEQLLFHLVQTRLQLLRG